MATKLTKTKVRKRVRAMYRDALTKDGYLDKKIENALNSGAIELSDFDDNYRLPRYILYAILKDLVWQNRPLSDNKDVAENLTHFI